MKSYRVSFDIWKVLSSILFVFWYVALFHKDNLVSGRHVLKFRVIIQNNLNVFPKPKK